MKAHDQRLRFQSTDEHSLRTYSSESSEDEVADGDIGAGLASEAIHQRRVGRQIRHAVVLQGIGIGRHHHSRHRQHGARHGERLPVHAGGARATCERHHC